MMMIEKNNIPRSKIIYLDTPIILHILEYQHYSLFNLIDRRRFICLVDPYRGLKTKLPLSLLLSSDVLLDMYKSVVLKRLPIIACKTLNLRALEWLKNQYQNKIIIWHEFVADITMRIAAEKGNFTGNYN